MAKLTRGDWAAHAPATNAAWLAYLACTAAGSAASPGVTAGDRRALRAFRTRAGRAPSAAALLADPYFHGCWYMPGATS